MSGAKVKDVIRLSFFNDMSVRRKLINESAARHPGMQIEDMIREQNVEMGEIILTLTYVPKPPSEPALVRAATTWEDGLC